MPSQKRLKSVAHSIAHHSLSGLCFLDPHLTKACKAAGVNCVSIELVKVKPNTKGFPVNKALYCSTSALKGKFLQTLRTEGFEISDLIEAKLTFHFPVNVPDPYAQICNVRLVCTNGNIIEDWIDVAGHRLFLKEDGGWDTDSFSVELNEESINAPIIYAREIPAKNNGCLGNLRVLAWIPLGFYFLFKILSYFNNGH